MFEIQKYDFFAFKEAYAWMTTDFEGKTSLIVTPPEKQRQATAGRA